MKTNLKIAAAFVAVAALGLAGCSSSTDSAEPSFKACQVTDTGGVDDKGFNQTAYKGVTDAAEQLGIQGSVLESQAETDYATNIQSFVDQGCNIIITVGFLLGDATATAANANPTVPFSIVDYAYD
ncbi:MAG: BMP family ABC transporter substrate-binding protein, partial [Actinomycetota bacterium]|nr:BMP family ABC transporter substrate-binding protein [Actinomycetota bacterium]